MGLPLYLAMTAEEMAGCEELPEHLAYMACHFSPYKAGLTELPSTLPAGSLLILDDRVSVWQHDPALISRQLKEAVDGTGACGVLLDFQSRGPQLTAIAQAVLDTVPGAVSAGVLEDGPVLLPPVPPNQLLQDYLAPWTGREIWLEAALDAVTTTVTRAGASSIPLPRYTSEGICHRQEELCCSYTVKLLEDRAVFTLFRTWEDLVLLQQQAQQAGIVKMVGLYQELAQ